MMRLIRTIFIVGLSFIFGTNAFSQQGFNVPASVPTTTTAPQNTQNLEDPYSGLTNDPGMYQMAERGQRESNKGRQAAVAVGVFCGAMAIPACVGTGGSSCRWWVACVGAAAVGVIALKGSGDKSVQSQEDLTGGRQGNVPRVNCPQCGDTEVNINSEDPDERRLAGQIRQLERNGFRINQRDGTVTDPKGRRFSSETFKSPERMRAAGISGLSMSDIRDMEKQVEQAAANAGGGVDKGEQGLGLEPGVGGGAPSAVGAFELPTPSELRGPSGLESAPSVAGSSVNFNGVPIGVRVDDIFGMMERRYDHEERRQGFLPAGP